MTKHQILAFSAYTVALLVSVLTYFIIFYVFSVQPLLGISLLAVMFLLLLFIINDAELIQEKES